MSSIGLKKKSIETVVYLLNQLEVNGFLPVIARNYENFPDFNHDLDLFVVGELETLIPIFHQVAKKLRWDHLTLCTHYANHKNDNLNIKYIFSASSQLTPICSDNNLNSFIIETLVAKKVLFIYFINSEVLASVSIIFFAPFIIATKYPIFFLE